jgi:Meiotically up-regulated gene 113
MLRAWRFPDKPRIKGILGQQLPQTARIYAVLLPDDQAAAVLALRREEVIIPDTIERARQRQQSDALIQGRPTTGPVPTDWSSQVVRNAGEPSFTYAFRFGAHDLWKIGHAKDVRGRLAEVNKHVPTEVLREAWTFAYQHRWPTEPEAHKMEQLLFSKLEKYRTSGERVQCSHDVLTAAWQSCFGA